MNKSNFHLLIVGLLLSFCCGGCISVDCGYTPNDPISKCESTGIPKYPITYSLDIKHVRTDFFWDPNFEDVRTKLENALKETGLFSEVRYAVNPEPDTYHASFIFHVAGEDEDTSSEIGMLCGYTLFLVPVWSEGSFDGTATLYLEGNPIYATARVEKMRWIIWLPFAPIGVFWNCAVGWHYVEKGVVNGLVNEIAEVHNARFVRDTTASQK